MDDPLKCKGERLDIIIRQGADFGPQQVALTYDDGVEIALAGCTISGHLRRYWNSREAAVALRVSITDAAAGAFEFSLTAEDTATLVCGPVEGGPESRYVWQLDLLDTTGRITPLYYGDAYVFRQLAA